MNARDLWAFLESKQHFADWMKNGLAKVEWYVSGTDYFVHKFVNEHGTPTDYYISVDIAKELAMVENNDKGRAVRRYFIEC